MNKNELELLRKKIIILNVSNYIFFALNIILIVIPFTHYWSIGFQFDIYFIVVTALNILAFYISYLIANKLNFFRKRHRHYTEKLNQEKK